MRKLNKDKRTAILATLVEGMGINATARVAGVSKLTVLRLLADVGSLCRDYHDVEVQNLTCQRIQVDEIWSFCGCKQRSKEAGKQGDGDVWVWIGIDADTQLVVSYLVGGRDASFAHAFMHDIADRATNRRFQLTSDGHNSYLQAVESAFGTNTESSMTMPID